VVYKALWSQGDKKNDAKVVAIKKVKNMFENEVYSHRILRELRLLRLLKGHNNVSKTVLSLIIVDCGIEDNHASHKPQELQ
jgi:serine/threonine protein kinase